MASRDYQAVSAAQIHRAGKLAERYPTAAPVLSFYAALTQFRSKIFSRAQKFAELPMLLDELVNFVCDHAPANLSQAARRLDQAGFERLLSDYWERRETTLLNSFFARAVLQPWAVGGANEPVAAGENVCPRCGHLPQVAVLRSQGHGQAINLVCSLCDEEWGFRRVCCPSCLEQDESQLEFFSAEGFEYFRVSVCRSCDQYILCVDAEKEQTAIPVVDELAALPLDVWANEKGFKKLQPNIAGI